MVLSTFKPELVVEISHDHGVTWTNLRPSATSVAWLQLNPENAQKDVAQYALELKKVCKTQGVETECRVRRMPDNTIIASTLSQETPPVPCEEDAEAPPEPPKYHKVPIVNEILCGVAELLREFESRLVHKTQIEALEKRLLELEHQIEKLPPRQ